MFSANGSFKAKLEAGEVDIHVINNVIEAKRRRLARGWRPEKPARARGGRPPPPKNQTKARSGRNTRATCGRRR